MKKIFKSWIFIFILGVMLSTSLTSVLAYSLLAPNVGYTPLDSNWKNLNGSEISDVDNALNNLYESISELEFEELYSFAPGTPANFSYTIETNTKNVLVVLSSIWDSSVSEVDSTISLPSNYTEIFDVNMGEMVNRHQGYMHTRAYFMQNAQGTISGRISYRGQIKVFKINRYKI